MYRQADIMVDIWTNRQIEKFVKRGVDQQTIWWMNWQISIWKDYYKDWHVYSITESKYRLDLKIENLLNILLLITFDMSVIADS